MDIALDMYVAAPVKREKVDWNSICLLLLLTVPAAIMGGILLLWPGVTWTAAIPYTTIELLGSFTAVLLAVFIIARYKKLPGTVYFSAGLIGTGIIEAFLIAAQPRSTDYVWLHSLAGIFGGVCIVASLMARFSQFPLPADRTDKRTIWLLGSAIIGALGLGGLSIFFSRFVPQMINGDQFTTAAWLVNTIPVALFLVAGITLFYQYRKTGTRDLFLFTAIVVFLFQASEVFYFTRMWTINWWFWQLLRLLVYLSVLVYVLKEYIQTGNALVAEIEEREKADVALRQAEEDWRDSFNSLDDIMLIIDRDYNILRINDSGLGLLGKTRDEITGEKCYRVFHREERPPVFCPCRKSFRYGKPADAETHDEIFSRYFDIKGTAIMNPVDKKPAKCVCLMRDISREIKAREKEQALQQELNVTGRLAAIGEVAAGIAHEINNPLTGVIGFAQMLADMDVPAEMREAVDVIRDGAQRTAGIVQKLLTFARRSKPNKECLDINAVLKSTVDIRSYEMRTNNISVETKFAPDIPLTMANFGQLQQVFLNLIVNAAQAISASGHEGHLVVTSEKTKDTIRVTVADNGIGIPKENIGKLFDPFFTTKTETGGTGLGLSISYGIIKEHGGTIKVKSAPGKGATFIVDLPIIAGETTPQTPPVPATDRPLLKNARILVVDDEETICRVLDRILTREGHRVTTAHNPETGLTLLKSETYDLVLLDMKMPGMSGIDLYKQMTDIDPSLPNKVVFITGDIISQKNRLFLDETKVPFLTKPFASDMLLRQVQSTLGGSEKDA